MLKKISQLIDWQMPISPHPIFSCLLSISCLLPVSFGQDWITQAPYPSDVDLLSVHFVSPTKGFISGRDDLLMMTLDGGETWEQASSVERSPQFSEDPIWKTQFVDELHGWAWGNNGYRTVDGGQTWQALPFVASVYDIQFLDSQNGFLISNLSVYRTNDGGQTVTSVWDWQNFNFVSDATFISPTQGIMAAVEDDVPGIFRTTDAGESWDRISSQALGEVLFVNQNIVVGSAGSKFYRSDNGGVDWQIVQDNTLGGSFVNGIEEIALIDADSIAAIDINGRIWVSNDAGLTWDLNREIFGNWGYGWDIQFPTPNVGFAVGRLGLIFKTEDGGVTWDQISNGAATYLNDIVMNDQGVGVAVGDNGIILRTDDFGRQWDLLPQFTTGAFAFDLNDVQKIDSDTFVAGGAKFLRSDDAGSTWTQGGSLPADILSLSFINDQQGWASGPFAQNGFFIAKTDDGGQNWDVLQSAMNTRVATKIQVHASGTGYALYPQTEQVLTTDGFEASFIPRVLPSGDSWQSFEYGSENVGWYGGFFGGLLRSDNGGFIFEDEGPLPNWIFSGGGTGHRLTDLRAFSEEEAYVTSYRPGAIYQGVIYQRVAGSWVELDPISVSTNQAAGAIHATDLISSGEIWTTGGNGFIFASGQPETVLLGDVNDDGEVDLLDVQPFVDLLTAGGYHPNADINGDGDVTLEDVAGFVDLISS